MFVRWFLFSICMVFLYLILLRMINKRVVIIGAGASGIAAGARLLANGFKNIIILEAEQRIGGRVWTIPFAANVCDLGAQWYV